MERRLAMLYCLKKEEVKKVKNSHFIAEFVNAEMLSATYVTDENAAREIIPKPLLPTKTPLATVFVARYPETNFGCVYNEGALFLHCEYKKERGLYCLSMPVDDDMAMVAGRESFGYPKKMADKITLEKTENRVFGSVIRKKKEILRIECELMKEVTSNFMEDVWVPTKDWDGTPCYRVINFLYKYFLNPGGTGFDYLPRLIREPTLKRKKGEVLEGRGEVKVSSSPFDPLGDVPVKEIRNMNYGKWHNTMLPGKVIGRAWNPLRFLKHAFFKIDIVPTLLRNYDPSAEKRAREIMRAARKF
jgi:acetoacetate decarboxylase